MPNDEIKMELRMDCAPGLRSRYVVDGFEAVLVCALIPRKLLPIPAYRILGQGAEPKQPFSFHAPDSARQQEGIPVPARKKSSAPTGKPAQRVLDTGTRTNELSTYEASRPRYGHSEDEGSWNINAWQGRSSDGLPIPFNSKDTK